MAANTGPNPRLGPTPGRAPGPARRPNPNGPPLAVGPPVGPPTASGSGLTNAPGAVGLGPGGLNFLTAYTWNPQEIVAFVRQVANDPRGHGVDPMYVKEIKGAAGSFESHVSRDVLADFNLPDREDAKPPGTGTNPSVTTEFVVPWFDTFICDTSFTRPDPVTKKNTPYLGLPSYTVFDFLGWFLSVTCHPPPTATNKNYYLPLVAMYARWCVTLALAANVQGQPQMVHIARIPIPKKPDMLILGSTTGTFVNRILVAVGERQENLEAEGIPPPDPGQRIPGEALGNLVKKLSSENNPEIYANEPINTNPPASELAVTYVDDNGVEQKLKGNDNYGSCAETFFYLYAARKQLNGNSGVRGFALAPPAIGATYDESEALEALRNPCQASCQPIITHLTGSPSGFDFRIATVKADVKNQGGAAGAASSAGAGAGPPGPPRGGGSAGLPRGGGNAGLPRGGGNAGLPRGGGNAGLPRGGGNARGSARGNARGGARGGVQGNAAPFPGQPPPPPPPPNANGAGIPSPAPPGTVRPQGSARARGRGGQLGRGGQRGRGRGQNVAAASTGSQQQAQPSLSLSVANAMVGGAVRYGLNSLTNRSRGGGSAGGGGTGQV